MCNLASSLHIPGSSACLYIKCNINKVYIESDILIFLGTLNVFYIGILKRLLNIEILQQFYRCVALQVSAPVTWLTTMTVDTTHMHTSGRKALGCIHTFRFLIKFKVILWCFRILLSSVLMKTRQIVNKNHKTWSSLLMAVCNDTRQW